MSDADVDVVRRAYEAINTRDFDAIADLWAPDGVYVSRVTTALGEGEVESFEQLSAWLRRMDETFEGLTFELRAIEDLGDGLVLSFGSTSGHGSGSGIPASFDWCQCHVVEDGRLVFSQSCEDRDSALGALRERGYSAFSNQSDA